MDREPGYLPVSTQRGIVTKGNKQGSAVSTRDMLKAAHEGRRLTIRLQDSTVMECYLAGMDDYHWKVVTIEEPPRVHLVHKTAAAVITIGGPDLEEQDNTEAITAIVSGFQAFAARSLGIAPT